MPHKGSCTWCLNERWLVDGRLCRACMVITQNTDPQFEWDKKAMTKVTLCDGCGFIRPVRRLKNKEKSITLHVCKTCSNEKKFLSDSAYWKGTNV